MSDHAAMSPSSAEMWLHCPASITKSKGMTRPSSRYAREGTAAHQIAEMILNGNLFPPGKITVEEEQFIVGLPMLRALNPYIDYVQQIQDRTPHVHIEAKVRLQWAGGLVWGTADCAAREGDLLRIVDLKYGKGVPVDPDSAQLKIYALAAVDTFWPKSLFSTVAMTVVQPRLEPVFKTRIMEASLLYGWASAELKPAVRAIQAGDTTEKVGTYCRWCVRKQECESFRTYKSSLAADIFDDGVDTLNT